MIGVGRQVWPWPTRLRVVFPILDESATLRDLEPRVHEVWPALIAEHGLHATTTPQALIDTHRPVLIATAAVYAGPIELRSHREGRHHVE